MNQIQRQRSLFWPILLIGIGVIWLLSNTEILPIVSVGSILRMWPLALIFLGLDLLIGRTSTLASAIIGLLAVGTLIAILVASPRINPQTFSQPTIKIFNEPLKRAKASIIDLNLSSYPVTVKQVKDQNNLFEAEIGVYGTLHYQASGPEIRRISLTHNSSPDFWFNLPLSRMPLRWDIGLNPSVPTDLTVDGGSGSANLDLSTINLTALNIDVGSGSFDITLPTSQDGYTANVEGGSGSLRVLITDNQNLNLKINGASGSIKIELPANGAVRIESLDSGSGSLSIPSRFTKIQNSGNRDEGIWQTNNFDTENNHLVIQIVDIGSGSIAIR